MKAITRKVSPAIAECEITHIKRRTIDNDLASRQHHAYEQLLTDLGCDLISLPAEADLPDSVFVEDAAIVLPELAIITRPGAESRRPETKSIAKALRPYRELIHIQPPGSVDGGDVLVLDEKVYVGLSTRSNTAAIEQMQAGLSRFGYDLVGIHIEGVLHLKSAVTRVGPGTLLVNPAWVDASLFPGWDMIEIDPSETYAANGLLIGNTVIYPAAFPKTQARLETHGIKTAIIDLSELAKAEGAVTCCSLIFEI